VTFAVTASLSLTAAINDPTPERSAFVVGALLASLGLIVAAASLRRLITRTWVSIGERIAGSWLLTIGLLLSAVQLFPNAAPDAEAARSPAEASSTPPTISDFAPAMHPDFDTFPMPFGKGGLPKGTN
jgi:hypothetical protein